MRIRSLLLLILSAVLLLNCSCQNQSGSETAEQPEPQRMAYHGVKASRVGDDIYYTVFVSSKNGERIHASEYGSENFESFVPCFDAVCNHLNREICCVSTSHRCYTFERRLAAFDYNGEPSLVIFNPVDICFSRPYSNTKVNLVCEDFLNADDVSAAYNEWQSSPSRPKRDELFVYGGYLYYAETRSGVRAQYRISLEGGDPERVFEEDNVIIRTIINDRFYGIRYDVNDWTAEQADLPTRDQIHYFRSDMTGENIEPLPEELCFFSLLSDDNYSGLKILDADEKYIYVMRGTKILAFSDSDINAEPILLWDMKDKITYERLSDLDRKVHYNDSVLYIVINTNLYSRPTLDSNGYPNPTQWYEKSTLYGFDIETGECKEADISSQNYLIYEILYADDKYVYAEGIYVHDDNRAQQGVTMRLTLDTMRYEAILPDRFWEYSAETASE